MEHQLVLEVQVEVELVEVILAHYKERMARLILAAVLVEVMNLQLQMVVQE